MTGVPKSCSRKSVTFLGDVELETLQPDDVQIAERPTS
jgi:hypothetical protein